MTSDFVKTLFLELILIISFDQDPGFTPTPLRTYPPNMYVGYLIWKENLFFRLTKFFIFWILVSVRLEFGKKDKLSFSPVQRNHSTRYCINVEKDGSLSVFHVEQLNSTYDHFHQYLIIRRIRRVGSLQYFWLV